VWSVISDLQSYPQWNPFITAIKGKLQAGERLEVTIAPPGVKPMTFRPTLLDATPNRKTRWLGRLGIPGLFDGEHSMEIVPQPGGGVRFIHRERFGGLLVPLFGKMLKKTEGGFEQMNEAVKARAESGPR